MTAKEYRKECEARRGGITEMEGKLCDELAEREHDIAELTAAVMENETRITALVKAARGMIGRLEMDSVGPLGGTDVGEQVEILRSSLAPFEGVETKEEELMKRYAVMGMEDGSDHKVLHEERETCERQPPCTIVYLANEVEAEITRRLEEEREEIVDALENSGITSLQEACYYVKSRSASTARKPLEKMSVEIVSNYQDIARRVNAIIDRLNEMEAK
jgi:hypothetical protein